MRIVIARSFRDASRLGLRQQVGRPAIGRIDHQRGLLARPPRSLAPVAWRACADARIWRHGLYQVVLLLRLDPLLAVGEFLLGIVGLSPKFAGRFMGVPMQSSSVHVP